MAGGSVAMSVAVLGLVLGLVLFVGVHSLSMLAPDWRESMVARHGEGPWKGFYSLVALAGLVLIVVGYANARYTPTLVYVPPTGLRALALLITLPVFPLLLAAYIPGKIRAKLKHPMLIAVRLWSAAHLLANGMLSDILLFGSLFIWATALQIALERRPQHRAAPVMPIRRFNDASAIIVGVIVYLFVILFLHRLLLGVSPIT